MRFFVLVVAALTLTACAASKPRRGNDQPPKPPPAPVAEPAEPRDPTPKLGVNAKPPAEVFIDGKSVGMTPYETRLPPGEYLVAVAWTEDCNSFRIKLEPGDHKTMFHPLDPDGRIGSGCPKDRYPEIAPPSEGTLAVVTAGEIKINQQIQFDQDKATIKPESHAVLDAVVKALTEHPEITLEVQGHTDDTGAAAHNRALSQQRAASVVAYLTSKGIDAKRLKPKGYGADKPLDAAKTDEARAKNRRVQFIRTES